MKRALARIFGNGVGIGVALLLALLPSLAFSQNGANNKAETVAKAETGQTDSAIKIDAMIKADPKAKIDPMIKKMDPQANGGKRAGLPSPDGHDLAQSCKTEVEGFDAGYCLGVVEGVIGFMRLCKPDRSVITLGEAADATARYLEAHPNKLKERDVVLARKALSKAYPCGPSR